MNNIAKITIANIILNGIKITAILISLYIWGLSWTTLVAFIAIGILGGFRIKYTDDGEDNTIYLKNENGTYTKITGENQNG